LRNQKDELRLSKQKNAEICYRDEDTDRITSLSYFDRFQHPSIPQLT